MTNAGRAIGWGLLVLVLLGAAFWRLDGLGARPLWIDEQWTERLVRESRSLGAILAVGSQDDYQHPPLGYVAAWLAAGDPPTAARLRLPSAVAGVASIAGLAAAGALLFGRRAGLLAAFLMGLSVYHVVYSQEARPYMLGVAWTVGLYVALLGWLRDPGRRAWPAALAVCGAAALYTYHLALLHVGVAGGVLGIRALRDWRRGERRTAAAAVAALAAIALAYLPQLPNLIGFAGGRGLEPNHVLALGPAFLHALVERWASAGATALLYEAAFVAGALRLARRRDLASLAVLGWIAAPFALFAAVPFAKYFDIRFLMSSLPAFFLLAGAGVDAAAGAVARASERAGLAPRRARLAGAFAAAAIAFVCWAPAEALRERLRASSVLCGNFVNQPELLEAEGRLCADHLVLNSVATEQQWILRSLRERTRIAPERLADYVGDYRFDAGPRIAITRLGDALVAQVEGQRAHQLVAESETRFWYRVLPGRSITFERDAGRRAVALELRTRNKVARARRTP